MQEAPGFSPGPQRWRKHRTCLTSKYKLIPQILEVQPGCPGRDSNPHGLAATSLSGMCVYHFRHPGTLTNKVNGIGETADKLSCGLTERYEGYSEFEENECRVVAE